MAEELHKEAEAIPVPEQLLKLRERKGLLWKVPLLILGVLLALAAVLWGLWLYNGITLTLEVEGPEEITLECGTAFEAPAGSAQFTGRFWPAEPEAVEVTVAGTVDPQKLGTYQLTYTASKELNYYLGVLRFEESRTLQVRVVDTTPPVITLHTDPNAYTLPGAEYVEEGFTATDNCDGDLTDQVERWVVGDVVYYKAMDNAENVTKVTRKIVYHDPVAPELTLQGKETMIVIQNTEYVDPGFGAKDNLDGDLTEKVTVTGTVDTATLGTYQLQYSVTDSFNNTTVALRNVIVREYPELPEDMPIVEAVEPVAPEGKVIYLTFDDGPSAYTDYLLDVLAKYDVKATFFVVNRGYHDTLRRIVAEGHTLAMHCGEHVYSKIYASEEAYFDDLKTIQDVILEQTGQLSTIVRFPGGTSNTVSRNYNTGIMTRLSKMLDAMGYRYFDWNVSSGDAGETTDTEEVFHNIIGGIQQRNISIVLQHDIKKYSVDAVEMVIQWALKNGYTFMALSNDSPVCEFRPHN